ncbi:hypothetical protein V6N12_040281 [Hibiscus sabdariffa]|uniref:Uncharacterized protein n=1 Tax=Hibiscus sabdariffa TaxID=183260 RepID=A0ABR2E505_9ROSI
MHGEQGERLEKFDDIAEELVRFFTRQIETEDGTVLGCNVNLLRELIHYSLPVSVCAELGLSGLPGPL